MARTTVYELHIKPMFRPIDRAHMLRLKADRRIDLWDYEQVRKHAPLISTWLDNGMPPAGAGGPWPEEWRALFRRWVAQGCQRLTPAPAENFALVLDAPNRYVLSCDVTLPSDSATAWIDVVEASADVQRYSVVIEDVPGAAASPSVVNVEEKISGPLVATVVHLQHAGGSEMLPVPEN